MANRNRNLNSAGMRDIGTVQQLLPRTPRGAPEKRRKQFSKKGGVREQETTAHSRSRATQTVCGFFPTAILGGIDK